MNVEASSPKDFKGNEIRIGDFVFTRYPYEESWPVTGFEPTKNARRGGYWIRVEDPTCSHRKWHVDIGVLVDVTKRGA